MEDLSSNEIFLDILDNFIIEAEKSIETEKLAKEFKKIGKIDFKNFYNVEKRAKLFLKISESLYLSSKISINEFFYYQNHAIEGLMFESKVSEGHYKSELQPIEDEIEKVKEKHNLKPDEYWLIDEVPPEYQTLNEQYEKVLDNKIEDLFREFASAKPLASFLNEKEIFEKIVEIGRKSVFVKDETDRLTELNIIYKKEADLSESAKAFLSASILLGSIIETKMIIKCLENPDKVKAVVREIKSNKGKINIKSNKPTDWNLNALIEVSKKCNWLPNIETEKFVFSTENICHFIRNIRNLVHPGNHIKKASSLTLSENNFKKIKNSYELICLTLNET
ncbi:MULTISPECIES: hypothetical protein [Tenacibaculum]|uniref:hypothetical protein n=1 Tax=Tenacibaculum TaxID=104267 RepID=UPI001E55AAFA|nr:MULTISPECIES: hypothetical protein [Tenacibaculum]MCD8455263.1 hypothetical protein [Tenacibaculum finnmarkense genomovar ulcerans]WBX70358.1 hypothetical protein PG912_08715 [Tenacibaculum retecalamus]